jgi:hypothetical protein
MIWNTDVSDEVRIETKAELLKDDYASRIDSFDTKIATLEAEIDNLKYERDRVKKQRPLVVIKWRDSVKWCLEVDAENFRYFLKSTPGVYLCIGFKHKVEITSDIKNKIAVTLASLFKEKVIGRYDYKGTYLYGLTKFFNDDLTDLKEEYKSRLDRLIIK